MAKSICLSFKDNDEEMKIYKYLKSKKSPSIFVKDLVEQYMNKDTQSVKDIEVTKEKQEIKVNQLKGLSSIVK